MQQYILFMDCLFVWFAGGLAAFYFFL